MDARTPHLEQTIHARGWRPERCDRVALVLQGGGALGAYQAGVYQALHEAHIEPDWVCGVSIGAINSAIIAGNPPERRLERLQIFWDRITSRKIWHYTPDGDIYRKARNFASSLMTTSLGQPGFFTPHMTNPWLSATGARTATSYYDTEPLRQTLLELVDFDMINDKRIRFAVGAVNVLSGNFIYFDNAHDEIIPEHIMASGALPPALPMVKVGTDHFWDGGIVSNTPLQHLLDQEDSLNSLVFQVDLFSARGALPRDIQDVMARHKDIMYSSRTRHNTDVYRKTHNLKARLHKALSRIPDDQLSDEERQIKASIGNLPEIAILQLIYQQKAYEGDAKDHEFSGTSMREHWMSGHEDTKRTLKRRDWIRMPDEGMGIVIHDVHRENEA
ncbi:MULTISPECIES: patatin-like phospholipase family protein [unclassified Bradyrhizobium]|uniref:patatin-like phospholipase family protein n=1 Tax=unclassified Bradyrhizobium TaxID=2631580 RepID=UPI001BAB6E03|nr:MULTISPECIES: patatin-like phospholipase family protein [unclassified Bradyrhizobium]MBR1224475.1 patatin-like phospholipase family protein [Bradyrhizobium sp. AUGA SZCCT0176]MBR1231098.1 patatin-like phospholipase family protein [Bradyrhizobium sp. AUGA SZCCT0182]MBR1283261.1 patatin-like phospholipase family protein [Bradyrhizobium sp. AUGA SZCCT0177]MBR1297977.1 patatin-like phospholipase family protein [Bradyrhizobium sp. AUGA SZCCT0042]